MKFKCTVFNCENLDLLYYPQSSKAGAELHGAPGGPWTTMGSAHPRPIQIGNLDAAAHAPYFVASMFLQPILSSSAEGATLRILLPAAPFRSLFLLQHVTLVTGRWRALDNESISSQAAHVSALQYASKSSFDYPMCWAMFQFLLSNLSVELLS